MGKLAEATGGAVTGPVTVTFPDGTRTFPDADTAEKAIGARKVEHKRGGFFVAQGSAFDADAVRDESSKSPKKK